MSKAIFVRLLYILPLLLYCMNASSEPQYKDFPPSKKLINDIASGGYILYMRHGKTDHKSVNNRNGKVDLTQCSTQRNLTKEGLDEVILIGHEIKKLNIPISEVYSSPYCRTKETAQAVFGNYVVDDKLAFSFSKNKAESALLGRYLFDAMKSFSDKTRNIVFVGHTANLKDGLGIWPKPEGVIVVFKKVQDEIIYKGMIKPQDWFST